MNNPVSDPSQPYRSLIAGYTDAIRASDFKANIAILFVAFMMGPILGNYTQPSASNPAAMWWYCWRE
jgi:hypothetical protein